MPENLENVILKVILCEKYSLRVTTFAHVVITSELETKYFSKVYLVLLFKSCGSSRSRFS